MKKRTRIEVTLLELVVLYGLAILIWILMLPVYRTLL